MSTQTNNNMLKHSLTCKNINIYFRVK